MNQQHSYDGADGFSRLLGIEPRESILILTDKNADTKPVNLLKDKLAAKCTRLETAYLPIELESDFPESIRKSVSDFDIIIVATSQSWYHVPTRRKAKYELGKRIVECYGLTMDMLREGALCADPQKIEDNAKRIVPHLKRGNPLGLESSIGTAFTAEIRSVYIETGNYSQRGSGGNLPGGEVSVGLTEGTANGTLVFDLSMDVIGSLRQEYLIVEVLNGKISSCSGKYSSDLVKLMESDSRLRNIAEIGIGINDLAITGRSVIEDEKQTGTAHVGFGNDTYFGGTVKGPHYDAVLSEVTLTCGGNQLVCHGHLNV